MTVEPGFGGQSFMRDVADAKLAAARAWLDPDGASEVQVDGGGRAETRGGHRPGRDGRDRRRVCPLPGGGHGGRGRTDPVARRGGAGGRRPSLTGRRMRALLQRVSRAEVRVDGAPVGLDRAGPAGAPGRRPRRRRGDRRRAGAPHLRAADLRGRRGSDEPLAARHRRRGAGRQPVHPLRGHPARPAAGLHRRRRPGPRAGPVAARGREDGGAGRPDASGEFGAEMAVELVNDGPFTIWLDTADRS